MQRRIRLLITVILVLGASNFLTAGVYQDEAQVLLKAAAHQELVQGDLEAAIEIYEKILDQYPSERNVAAEALLKLGMSYEKLGKNEAKEAYERLLKDYADQSDQAQRARTRLEELDKTEPRPDSGPTMRRVWVDSDKTYFPDFSSTPSPDGRYLPFIDWATGDVAVHDLQTGVNRFLTTAKPISGTKYEGSAYSTAFSPDGTQVAYSYGNADPDRYELRIVSFKPGNETQPRVIYSNPQLKYLHANGWTPEGKRILVTLQQEDRTAQFGFVSVETGKLTLVKSSFWSLPWAKLSPDGRYIAYYFFPQRDAETRDIYIVASDGSNEVSIVNHPADDRLIDWSPSGDQLLFNSNRGGTEGIWTQRIANGRAIGAAELVKGNVGQIRPFCIASDGKIYYLAGKGHRDIFTVTLDPDSGKIAGPPSKMPSLTEGKNRGIAWSPDGKHLAYVDMREGSFSGTLVVQSLVDGVEKEINTQPNKVVFAGLRWSPDGTRLLYTGRSPANETGLYIVDVDTGNAQLLRQTKDEETILYPAGWPSNGEEIYFSSCCSPRSVLARNLATGVERKIFQLSKETFKAPALSPDARSLALFERDGSEIALKLVSTVNGEARNLYQIPDTESQPHGLSWAPDGLFIYFTVQREKRSQELWRVSVDGGEAISTGLSYERLGGIAFHPNGRQLAFSGSELEHELWVMENFLEPKQ